MSTPNHYLFEKDQSVIFLDQLVYMEINPFKNDERCYLVIKLTGTELRLIYPTREGCEKSFSAIISAKQKWDEHKLAMGRIAEGAYR